MSSRSVALVIGGSRDVWAELEAALTLTEGLDRVIVATNFAGGVWPGDIDAWATLHPELFAAWREERFERGLNTDYRAFVHAKRNGPPDAEAHPLRWSGSSGLYAAQVALEAMGAAGAILCGVPIDEAAGHFQAPGDWSLARRYRPAFEAAKRDGAEIRSMSGWTGDLLGRPDAGWLASLAVGPPRPKKPRERKGEEITVRIKMLRTRNFTPPEERRITVKYLADWEYTVKRAHGEAMAADGDATEIPAPARRPDPLDHHNDGRRGGAKKPGLNPSPAPAD